jgi:hypothetical protein
MDGDLPVSAILSSASLHDTQVAIPLARMNAQRLTNLYDWMNAAYDSPHMRWLKYQGKGRLEGDGSPDVWNFVHNRYADIPTASMRKNFLSSHKETF